MRLVEVIPEVILGAADIFVDDRQGDRDAPVLQVTAARAGDASPRITINRVTTTDFLILKEFTS